MDRSTSGLLSVCVCTLNSHRYIDTCIDAIQKNLECETYIVDASPDPSYLDSVVNRYTNVHVHYAPPTGLASQRQYILPFISTPFLAYVDSQDVLHPDCLRLLLEQMTKNKWDAIQASTLSFKSHTYWQQAYDSVTQNSINQVGPASMIGRPCIYRTEAIRSVGFDDLFGPGIGCEDVDVSIQFELKGFAMGMGTGITYRQNPATFTEWLSKWVKYGKGDACIVAKYPHKFASILHHQLINYPLRRPLKDIRKTWRYLPFYACFGYVRFISMLCYIMLPKRKSER